MDFLEEQQEKFINKYDLHEYDNTGFEIMKRIEAKKRGRVREIVKDTIKATAEMIKKKSHGNTFENESSNNVDASFLIEIDFLDKTCNDLIKQTEEK